ncbi:MAG TPA: TrbI/VirB10 family protein [Caulobacteraceae bacterium]|nr:TrbI/VirB10 family protein [Caulobacteraceae bacterium]
MSELPPAESAVDIADVNGRTARRQYLKWMAMAGVVAVGGGVFIWQELSSPSAEEKAEDPARIVATLDAASGARMSPEATAAEANERAQALEQELLRAREDNVALKAEAEGLRTSQAADRADAMATIEALEKAATRPAEPPMPSPLSAPAAAPGFSPNPFAPAAQTPSSSAPPRRTMAVVRTEARAPAAPEKTSESSPTAPGAAGAPSTPGSPAQGGFMSGALQTFETASYVPPNAYVKGRVLVGVDAAAAVNVSSDPKPVLFRLLGPAVGVGTAGRFQSTDLTGCTVNGAAFGELSSEKVYIKLQRISCPAGREKFSVATVEGYVAHAGKAGVRGRVISREGDLTNRAMVAGALQGLGEVFSGATANGANALQMTGDGLFGSPKLTNEEIAKGAVGGGVSGAASMLADYYIKRAEQYQPVIEMPTGIDVELVFLSGFEVGGAR